MTDGERIELLEEKLRRMDAEISGLKLANDLLDMKIQALQPNVLGPQPITAPYPYPTPYYTEIICADSVSHTGSFTYPGEVK